MIEPEAMNLDGAQVWDTEEEAQAFADACAVDAPLFVAWHVVPLDDGFAVVTVSSAPPPDTA